MKKVLYALIIPVVLVITFIAHSFFFGTGDIITDIEGIFNRFSNHDNEVEKSLTFDEVRFEFSIYESAVNEGDYYNYSLLDESQKKLYNTILDAALTMTTGNIQLGKTTKKDTMVALYAVKYDYPEIFWLGFEFGIGENDGDVYLRFDKGDFKGYTFSNDDRVRMMNELNLAVKAIHNECINDEMSDFEKEVAIHDWICQNVRYDDSADNDDSMIEIKRKNPELWTAYGAIVNRVAVCEGYSKAFQLLMYSVGINCNLVCGEVSDGSPHMWNMVLLDNEWYYVDVLWDDTSDDYVFHSFLNVTDDMISDTHSVYPVLADVGDKNKIYSGEYNLKLPEIDCDRFNYYSMNGTAINSDDEFYEVVTDNIKKAAANGCDSIEFYYTYKEINENVVSYDIKNNRIFSSAKKYFSDCKGIKYIAYPYGSFILMISR